MDNESSRNNKLESILQDGSSEPHSLPLEYLRKITNNFSNGQLLGVGGFGKVYKGMRQNGESIAVKKLDQLKVTVQKPQFENEVYHLMRLKHPNIVRFVGYCYETRNECVLHDGKYVFAEMPQKLVCLEYLPNGSLDRHLSDESSGLDWYTRHRIIRGTCFGLHYLHEQCKSQFNASIIHLDLKPANILLDDNMVPKIADFGLSKLIDTGKTQTRTTFPAGSLGYMAPEYIYQHTVSIKADIYSLGVIIIEVITGCRFGPSGIETLFCKDFVEPVLKNWRNRLEATPTCTSLETDCQQIEICLEIGLSCTNFDPGKRPTTTKVIEMLNRCEIANCDEERIAANQTGESSRRVIAAVVKERTADGVKGKDDVIKVDPLRVERTKVVVVEAPRETTAAVVQAVAESTSRSAEYLISLSPNRWFQRIITTWIKGQHLGSGSFGSVYEAISDDGFFFAVKEVSLADQGLIEKQYILQLELVISLLSRLEHENIVQYFGTSKEGGKLYIFLELVTHGSLAALYQKYCLQDSQVSAYTRQILNGLYYLHQRNVLHREIKCANILVDASGLVKLADFGLAREMSILSQAKSSKGTVYWMAPEVAKAKPHGPPADIWSLGCTVLEMLTGKVPYPDMEWTDALLKIGRGIPPEIPDTLSEDARDFIKKCVQANPNDRPSAAQLFEHPFVQRPLQRYGAT